MKNVFAILIVVAVVVAGFFLFRKDAPDYKNISYIVDDETVTLVSGVSEVPIPDSSTVITTKYFGNLAKGDLNADGISDLAFLLTQNGGGTGTFYYVVAALQTKTGGYQGTNAVYLGDRIAPQTTEIRNGEIVVNYADRKGDEGFATPPSVAVSKHLKVVGTNLVEISDHDDLIRVTTPLPDTIVQSPLTVTGTARGNWYFEASFPVELIDANGKQLAIKPAQAQGEWMTTEFVPFSVTLIFPKPTTATGTLILRKDNPSGLLEHEDSISILVRF